MDGVSQCYRRHCPAGRRLQVHPVRSASPHGFASRSARAYRVQLTGGFAGHNAIFADDDDEDESKEVLIKKLSGVKVNLQQGLTASEQEGQPISEKFEVDEGNFQLSVYTTKDGKFYEVLVDYTTGKVAKVEQITKGDDLAAAIRKRWRWPKQRAL